MAEYIECEAERDVCERPPITQAIKGGEKSICWSCFHWEVCFAKENQPCIRCTRYIPAADVVERKHGKWVDMYDGWVCTACNEKNDYSKLFNFCPNCGARMKSEGEE